MEVQRHFQVPGTARFTVIAAISTLPPFLRCPLTGYRGWTFKNQQNEAMLEYGVGLQPNNSRVIGDAVVDVIRNSPADESLFTRQFCVST